MSDADRVGDELQSRLRGLAGGAERTAVPGMADVRRRRARRQRNAVLATAGAVVAVVGAATLVLQPLGEDPRLQPIGPGPSASRPVETGTGALTTTPTDTSTTPPDSSTATTTRSSTSSTATGTTQGDPGGTILTLDLNSLVTAPELLDAGVQTGSTDLGDADGQPTLPALCTAGSWQEEHSNPSDRVSGSYLIAEGQVVLDLFAYDDGTAANAALVKLKDDARACPGVNEFLTVSVTAVGASIGDEFVVFALDAESGDTGAVERIWVTMARVGNVLVAATIDRDPGFTGDVSGDEQLSRAAAQANVDHLLAG